MISQRDYWTLLATNRDIYPAVYNIISILLTMPVSSATNRDIYPVIYNIISIYLTMPVSSATSERSFSAMRRMQSYIKLIIGYERLSNVSLMHIQVDLDMIIDDLS